VLHIAKRSRDRFAVWSDLKIKIVAVDWEVACVNPVITTRVRQIVPKIPILELLIAPTERPARIA
jgi:hypothetical protein